MQRPLSLFTTSLLTVGSLSLAACSDDPPPAPSEVRSRITSDLGNVLHETAAASDKAELMIPTQTVDMLSNALGFDSTAVVQTLVAHTDEEEGGFDPDAIIEELNTKVFTDANEVEDGIYAVPSSLVCETSDADCATSFDKLALRVRVSENGSKLKFAVQLGTAHDEPLEVALEHTSLALSVDLDEAQDAAIAIATAFGQTLPNAEISGKVTGKLTILGAAHAKVAFDIDRALDIKVAENGALLTGPDAFRLTSAAAHVFEIEVDGAAGTGAFALGLADTTLHTPGEDRFDLDLPGATAEVALAANQPLQIKNISLGNRTTKLSKNGALAVGIDLNANDGRKLDAVLAFDDSAGTGSIAVSPKLDAQIQIDHAALGGEPSLYDVTRVQLTGGLQGADGSDQIQVVNGSFAITTNPAQYGFTATSGQCVRSSSETDPSTGDDYTKWTAGVCTAD